MTGDARRRGGISTREAGIQQGDLRVGGPSRFKRRDGRNISTLDEWERRKNLLDRDIQPRSGEEQTSAE